MLLDAQSQFDQVTQLPTLSTGKQGRVEQDVVAAVLGGKLQELGGRHIELSEAWTHKASLPPACRGMLEGTMKAAVLNDFGQPLNLEDVELDPPRTGEVQLRIGATGVCHSDYHVIKGEW